MYTKEDIICNGYIVDDAGSVYSKRTNRVLKYRLDKNGYKRINLRIYNKTVTFYISNLVMLFHNDKYKYIGYKDVMYKDNNKLNTTINNLFTKY